MEIPEPLTRINLWGCSITEPTSAGTNLVLALLCYLFYTKSKNVSQQWRWFFLLMSISTGLGAIVHGSRDLIAEKSAFNIWMMMNLISGTAMFFAQLHTIKTIPALTQKERMWTRIISLQLLLFYIFMVSMGTYEVVKIHGTIALLPVMFANLFFANYEGGKWIGLGISLSAISAVVHSNKFSFNPWFNYIDIAHIVLMATFYFMFKGANMASVSRKVMA